MISQCITRCWLRTLPGGVLRTPPIKYQKWSFGVNITRTRTSFLLNCCEFNIFNNVYLSNIFNFVNTNGVCLGLRFPSLKCRALRCVVYFRSDWQHSVMPDIFNWQRSTLKLLSLKSALVRWNLSYTEKCTPTAQSCNTMPFLSFQRSKCWSLLSAIVGSLFLLIRNFKCIF